MKIKLYVMQGACCAEDGELNSYSSVHATLEDAKKALEEDYQDISNLGDEEARIADDGMSWWSNGFNQYDVKIVEHEIELAVPTK